jgi:hypothetical protein
VRLSNVHYVEWSKAGYYTWVGFRRTLQLIICDCGRSDEGLAGAINRYARRDAWAQWDREGELDDDDNFLIQKTP